MKRWKRLRHNQYDWYYISIGILGVLLLALAMAYMGFKEARILSMMRTLAIWGLSYSLFVLIIFGEYMKISKGVEKIIRSRGLCKSTYTKEQGVLGTWTVEKMHYYPIIHYKKIPNQNIFCIRIRTDGLLPSEKIYVLEKAFSDKFRTECTDKIEELGYLTYCFALRKLKQNFIKSYEDIPKVGEHEIMFSKDIVWDWKRSPHLLLTGNTGSGKTMLAMYIIKCLIHQGVRIVYCDPKNDMGDFMRNHPCVNYVTKENDIAKVVRETEEEVRMRERDLQNIGIEDADFEPVFLFFDELIAFSKFTDKRNYDETMRRLAAIIVTGRGKRVYGAMLLQRPDTSYIEGAIRDNLGCRICMGQMSDTAYKMAFGSDFSDVKNYRREIGSGLIFRQGVDTKPREFLAPFICKGALNRD